MTKTLLVALLLWLMPTAASATTIAFDYFVNFGDASPGGSAPWLSGTLTNDGPITAGYDTRLTLTPNLTGTEFITGVYFNLDPALDPSSLLSVLVQNTPDTAYLGLIADENDLPADGGGYYDLLLNFNNSAGARFSDGETIIIDFAGVAPGDFVYLAEPHGGHGPFYSAAHLQGISGGLSTWIGIGLPPTPRGDDPPTGTPVPEPTTMLLLGTGLLAVARYRTRRRT